MKNCQKIFKALILGLVFIFNTVSAQEQKTSVIAYWFGDTTRLKDYKTEKLTHIIYSFLHLKNAELAFDSEKSTEELKALVALKKNNPDLKIMIALGGWEGCKTCSSVFSKQENREMFAQSVKSILEKNNADGIDIDWEYPTIKGPEGHLYQEQDRDNFTNLIKELRKVLGEKYEISFAAGGFNEALEKSIDWLGVAPYVNRVNLMSYDLYNGMSTSTGHHTPIFNNNLQKESVDNAVKYLDKIGFPKNKIVIGAAFYGRSWKGVSTKNNGLYQKGTFKDFIPYRNLNGYFDKSYKFFWDNVSKAPYAYSEKKQIIVSYDNPESISLKTKYVIENKLGGIMFWQLSDDDEADGLIQSIYNNLKQ